jgi:hypothetical protein
VILDSEWEAEFCRVAESHPKVRAYVKNHNLGLEVPYRYGSETRKYRPDFIVLVDTRARGNCSSNTSKEESAMHVDDVTKLLQVIAWPLVVLIGMILIRPHLRTLMSESKLKLSMFEHSIETTLPELQEVIQEQAEGALTPEHIQYLESLSNLGLKSYPDGVKSEERKFLRPLRNAGLLATVPRNAFLTEATAIQLAALGRSYMRARRQGGERPSVWAK